MAQYAERLSDRWKGGPDCRYVARDEPADARNCRQDALRRRRRVLKRTKSEKR
jgi:hypothetical protein